MESLRGSESRKDFDRVTVDKALTPAQVAAKKLAAAAKKAAKLSEAKARKLAKKQPKPAAPKPATGT